MKSALYESYKFVDSKENQLAVIDERELLGKEFRIYGNLDNPLFLAKDVANWIEHNQVSRMIELVDTDEKLKCLVSTSGKNEDGNLISSISGDGQRREMWFLTEDGLYEVLMQSRKPIAKKFKKQVKQILKQIRQTGGYIPHSPEDDDLT
ncbi:MAG: Bro-N domain-containing protein, partial [Bacilli bacterium]